MRRMKLPPLLLLLLVVAAALGPAWVDAFAARPTALITGANRGRCGARVLPSFIHSFRAHTCIVTSTHTPFRDT